MSLPFPQTTNSFEYLNGCSAAGTEAFYFQYGSSLEVSYPILNNSAYSYTPGEKLEGLYKIQNITGNIYNLEVRCLSGCDIKFNKRSMSFELDLLCAKIHRIQIAVDIDLSKEIELKHELKMDKQVLAMLRNGEGDTHFIQLPGYEFITFQCAITKVSPYCVDIWVENQGYPVKICGSTNNYYESNVRFNPKDDQPYTKTLTFVFNPDIVRHHFHTTLQILPEKQEEPALIDISQESLDEAPENAPTVNQEITELVGPYDQNCPDCINWECLKHWGSPWSSIPPNTFQQNHQDGISEGLQPSAPPMENNNQKNSEYQRFFEDDNQVSNGDFGPFQAASKPSHNSPALNIESLMENLSCQPNTHFLNSPTEFITSPSKPQPSSSESHHAQAPPQIPPRNISSIEATTIMRKQAFYEKIFTNTKYTDVILVNSKNEEVPTFRCFLAEASPIFKAIFDSKENEFPIRIEIGEFDFETMKQVIQFCQGSVIIGDEMKLLKFANKYSMHILKASCLSIIGKNITPQNVCERIELAYSENNSQLKEKCLKVLAENKNSIIQDSIKNLSKDILLDLFLI